MVGTGGAQQVVRFFTGWQGHRGFGLWRGPRRLVFAQDALGAGAAELNTGAQHMAGKGAGAEFALGAKPAQFMGRPAHGIVEAVPDDGAGEQAAGAVPLEGFDPRAEGVGMQDEMFRRLDDAPA